MTLLLTLDDGSVQRALANAVEPARAAAVEEAGAASVGEHVGVDREDAVSATHRFAAKVPGYRGWHWSVTLATAGDGEPVTVSEVVLQPGPEALVAPTWVPWDRRVRAGDLGVGDIFPTDSDDPRLAPAYLASDDPAIEETAVDAGIGRVHVLSRHGRLDAAERWRDGEFGPRSDMARSAPGVCGTCGFFVPLAGSLRAAFGVCGNEISPGDGHVVNVEYGCGAHSETEIEASSSVPVAELVYDDSLLDMEPLPDEPAAEAPAAVGVGAAHESEATSGQPSAEAASVSGVATGVVEGAERVEGAAPAAAVGGTESSGEGEVTAESVVVESASAESAIAEPASAEPVVAEPAVGEPEAASAPIASTLDPEAPSGAIDSDRKAEVPSGAAKSARELEGASDTADGDHGTEAAAASPELASGPEAPSVSVEEVVEEVSGPEAPSVPAEDAFDLEAPSVSAEEASELEAPSVSAEEASKLEVPSVSAEEAVGSEGSSVSVEGVGESEGSSVSVGDAREGEPAEGLAPAEAFVAPNVTEPSSAEAVAGVGVGEVVVAEEVPVAEQSTVDGATEPEAASVQGVEPEVPSGNAAEAEGASGQVAEVEGASDGDTVAVAETEDASVAGETVLGQSEGASAKPEPVTEPTTPEQGAEASEEAPVREQPASPGHDSAAERTSTSDAPEQTSAASEPGDN